jgi:hypothetical protein
MREHALELGGLPRAWPCLTLREKRVRLVEERLGTLVTEARMLGIGPADLTERLRRLYEEDES